MSQNAVLAVVKAAMLRQVGHLLQSLPAPIPALT